MPRKSLFNVNEYFDALNDAIVCKMCDRKFISNRSYNLKTHLEKVHKVVVCEKKRIEIPVQKHKTKKIKCDVSKKLLIQSYIGLVTDEGVSFNTLNSEHMRNIIDPICKGIEKESGTKFYLNADNCKRALSEVARNIVKCISSECEKKLLSLKVDSATISAQFIRNDKIVTRILGIVESKDVNSNSSIDLAVEIQNVMRKYNIDLQQIVSITNDGGYSSPPGVISKSFKILTHLSNDDVEGVDDNDNDDELEDNYDDNEIYFQHIDLIEKDAVLRVGNIPISPCAAHMTHLVALETSKNIKIKKYIRNCRNLVKFLRRNRTGGYRDLFKSKSLKIPKFDCPTRWGSTYSMISEIQNSKELIESLKSVTNKSVEENFDVNEDLWNFIDSYCVALGPLQKAMSSFQEEQLHYGDFYAKWLQCRLIAQKKVEENGINRNSHLYKINSVLLESMKRRTKTLFSNCALAACLYLDPRFHHLLLDAQKQDAIDYLKVLWTRLTTVYATDAIVSNTIHTTHEITIKSEEMDDEDGEEDDILGAFLDKEFYTNNTKNDDDISTKIERLKIPYSKNTTNILAFWKERKYTDPEIYALSNICFGIPATQVSVESSLSSLKLVLSDESRNCLKDDSMENLLLVQLNPEFLGKAVSELDSFFTHDDCADE